MAKKKRPSTPSPKPAPAAKRKPGRPHDSGYKPSDRDKADVEVAAAIGIPHEDIVLLLKSPTSGKPISPTTLRKVFKEELRLGATRAKLRAGANLLKLTETSAGAAIFYAKTRLGMTERIHVKHSGKVDTTPHLTDEQMDRRIMQLLEKEQGPSRASRQPRRPSAKR